MMKKLKTSFLFCLVLASPSLLSAEKITVTKPVLSTYVTNTPGATQQSTVSCDTTVFLTEESLTTVLNELKQAGVTTLSGQGKMTYKDCGKEYNNLTTKEKFDKDNVLLSICKQEIVSQLEGKVIDLYLKEIKANPVAIDRGGMVLSNLLNIQQKDPVVKNGRYGSCESTVFCSVDLSGISKNDELFNNAIKDTKNQNYPLHYARKHITFKVKMNSLISKAPISYCTTQTPEIEFVK